MGGLLPSICVHQYRPRWSWSGCQSFLMLIIPVSWLFLTWVIDRRYWNRHGLQRWIIDSHDCLRLSFLASSITRESLLAHMWVMYSPFALQPDNSGLDAVLIRVGLLAYPAAVLFFPFAWYFNYTSPTSLPPSVVVLLSVQMVLRRMGDFAATSVIHPPSSHLLRPEE